jgi:hypothetical protein
MRRSRSLCLVVAVAAVSACAEMAPPPGGPADKTPPRLLGYEPDSLSVSASEFEPLRFLFSENVDRGAFASALQVVPAVKLSKPRFDGLNVHVHPLEPWPPDAVIFWSLSAAMKDKHGVNMGEPRSGAFSRRDSLPAGVIRLLPTVEADAWKKGVRLQADLMIPPEAGERRGTLYRRSGRGDLGTVELSLLEIPSGPYQLSVFLDLNGNGRRDEREAIGELDSLFLRGPNSILDLGTLRLVDLEAPVSIWLCAPATDDSARVYFYAEALDSEREPRALAADSTGCTAGLSLAAGRYRAGAWIDRFADQRFGADSLGVSERFLLPIEFEILPAQPDTILLAPPYEAMHWSALDTLRPPPVPKSLHRDDGR